MVESQPSKLLVAGSSPVSRSGKAKEKAKSEKINFSVGSRLIASAHVAQSVEHFLGKEEVTGSIPVVSSADFVA